MKKWKHMQDGISETKSSLLDETSRRSLDRSLTGRARRGREHLCETRRIAAATTTGHSGRVCSRCCCSGAEDKRRGKRLSCGGGGHLVVGGRALGREAHIAADAKNNACRCGGGAEVEARGASIERESTWLARLGLRLLCSTELEWSGSRLLLLLFAELKERRRCFWWLLCLLLLLLLLLKRIC